MDCIYLREAHYIKDFKIFLKFNTDESGIVDLKEIVYKNKAAAMLREPANFANFHLDPWPTLAWECGFDIAPETLYEKWIHENTSIK